uniref:Ig-like domain-containing protein n=1 Tax=Gasterosteus aculeatus aculeatus TaxID=481459 RepID=A0AAQ4R864_GASAC
MEEASQNAPHQQKQKLEKTSHLMFMYCPAFPHFSACFTTFKLSLDTKRNHFSQASVSVDVRMGHTLFGALGLFCEYFLCLNHSFHGYNFLNVEVNSFCQFDDVSHFILALNILLYCGHAQDPRPVLTVSPSWTSPGDSVTLTCSVGPPSAGWRFFWYKAVPHMSRYTYYTYELLAGGTTGTEQDSYILHGQTHTAGYACKAGRGDPVSYTQYSDVKFVWSGGEFVQTFIFLHKGINVLFVLTLFVLCVSPNDVSSGVNPAASLTVSPHRLQHFSAESLSPICEGNSAEWRVMMADEYGRLSPCSYWGEMTGSTCNTTRARSGVYWCESVTQFSNAANITIHSVSRPVLTVSPSWTSPGDSVTLTCSVEHPSAGWRFFWYKAVPDLSDYYKYYTYELLAGGTTGTEQDSYILHGQTHTAGYVCRAGRGDPVFYTLDSFVKFVWSGGVNPAASLTVSPHRLQHFSTESLSLICEGNSTEWRVIRADEYSRLSRCFYWGEMTGSTCNTNTTTASSGVYWCESETQFSNAANITIHNPEEAASSSVFLVPLVVGLVSGVLLIILLLLFLRRYRKSEASSLSRSQRTNQSPARDHMINQGETQDGHYASLLPGDSCLYEAIGGSEEPKHGTNDEPEESVYENVRMETAAGTSDG